MAEAQIPQNVPQANVLDFLQGAAPAIPGPDPNAAQNAVQAVPQPDIGPVVVCCFLFICYLFVFPMSLLIWPYKFQSAGILKKLFVHLLGFTP